MKTILFTYMFPFHPERGGIERVIDLLATSLIKRGYNVLYLCLSIPESYKGYNYPAPLYTFPHPWEKSKKNRQFYENFLREHKVDIVFNNSFDNRRPLYLQIGENPKVKRISIVHNRPLMLYHNLYGRRRGSDLELLKLIVRNCYTLLKGGKRTYKRRLEQTFSYISKNSDRVSLLSTNFKEEYLQLAPNTPEETLIATPNPNTYPVERADFKKKKQLLLVGRLEYLQKRPDRALDVWKMIYRKYPDWELVIVGDGPDREMLKGLARKVERVKIVGFQDPKPYYEEARIFCLTSNFEGWGMVLTEAMTHGVVPIAFNSFAAVTDIIEDGKNGLLVSPYSLTEYAEKLSLIMDDEERRAEMANYGKKSVEKYSIENVTDRWEAVFNSLYD